MPEGRSALLVGATGLIGGFLLDRLLASPRYARVAVWVRRPLGRSHAKLVERVIDFGKLDVEQTEAEDVYCCLGTTIKVAGSQEAFRRVDYEYPVALVRAAAHGGAKRFLVVSALGANPQSGVFYNRVKGEMEAAVQAAGVPAIHIFRPSLLVGPRAEVRMGERVGMVVGRVLGPLLGRYRPILADEVAAAMLAVASGEGPSEVFESDRIRALARGGSV